MTVKAIRQVSVGQNGIGAFILPCRKMDLRYCDWGGSSRGMRGFLKSHLRDFAVKHPQIEFNVSPKPGKHPLVTAYYINGKTRTICMRNLEPLGVLRKVEMLRDSTGMKNRKLGKPVYSLNEGVRGIWSPYHGDITTV